jgi:LAO/AO transport system kinase
MIRMGPEAAWTPPVVRTATTTGEGLDELWEAIKAHRAHLEETGGLERARRERLVREVEQLAAERLRGRIRALLSEDAGLAGDLVGRRVDPYRAASILAGRIPTGS